MMKTKSGSASHMTLDCAAGLAPQANHEKACFNIDLI
jgi:hypothetical protein